MTDGRGFTRSLPTRSLVADLAWAVFAALLFLAPIELELEHSSLLGVTTAAAAIAVRRPPSMKRVRRSSCARRPTASPAV